MMGGGKVNRAEVEWYSADWPMIGQKYRHIKTGGLYTVVNLALLESTLEPLVVYHPDDMNSELDGQITWARPLSQFMDGRFEELD